jgi:aryl-alcohol dehydrogenase-like predicted oxidoreductase
MKLGLGTVQFGLDYGVSNSTGKTPEAEARRILQLAAEKGVRVLDTAAGYGDSEEVLGRGLPAQHEFAIVTKTPVLPADETDNEHIEHVLTGFRQSLSRLGQEKVYGLLVHRAEELLTTKGERLMAALQDLKQQGLVSKIGVTVYGPEQTSRILDRYFVDLVQLPFNIYDQRFLRSGVLDRLKLLDIEVHARSAFLQGLLLMPPDRLAVEFNAIRAHHAQLYREITAAGMTPLEASLRFCLAESRIDQVIVGCETQSQLGEILRVACEDGNELLDPERFAVEDEAIVNPARWTR